MIDPITQCNLSLSFTFTIEHTKGNHFKFWEAQAYPDGSVLIRYGRIGACARSIWKDREYFEKTAPKKLKKGYAIKKIVINHQKDKHK
jgi:predicted DNA-binding WGR domain protein